MDEYKPRGFKVSDPYGLCPFASTVDYLEVTYDSNGDYSQVTGPDGSMYNYFLMEDLMSAFEVPEMEPMDEEYVVYLLPLKKEEFYGQ